MNGIPSFSFDRTIARCFVCLASLVVTAAADSLTLEGEARLQGTVLSIKNNGALELLSEISPEPVLLKGSAVKSVVFTAPKERSQPPTSRVELVNGDILPMNLEQLDEHRLVASSPEAGQLEIPRQFLRSLHLGIHEQRVVYAGPDPIENWIRDRDGSKSWSYDNGVLTAQGAGEISRKIEPVSQFILRFSLKWQNNPNLQFSFADPLMGGGQAADRYYMQFTGAGFEIKREYSEGRRYLPIAQITRPPDQYPGGRLKVEIRVDRKRSMLHLFLNGEPEGRWIDPSGKAPAGGGISLVSHAPNHVEQEVGEVEIVEWDDAGDRHRTEDRGDPAADSLIGRSAERWGGRLLAIRNGSDGIWFSFKSDFQEEPVELPESEVSTVFFASASAVEKSAAAAHPFVLRLRGNGSIRVSSCTFDGDAVQVVHPLLGSMTLRRSGIAALERQVPQSPAQPKP